MEMSDLVSLQIRNWLPKSNDNHSFLEKIIDLNEKSIGFNVLIIDKNGVEILKKPTHIKNDFGRARVYKKHFESVIEYLDLSYPIILGCFVGDGAGDIEEGATFSFQRRTDQNNLLLPDIDMLNSNLYSGSENFDLIPYEKKESKAIFVGSTSGAGGITIDMIKNKLVPRINSALFFKNDKLVDYKLTNICQCANVATELYIKENICDAPRVSWQEQLKYRFLISVDGNGATCSRVNRALMSNSVLLKYHSDSVLFFFPLMEPWKHYIPIESDREVVEVVQTELKNPGNYKTISDNAKDLIKQSLNFYEIYKYTSLLINEYSKLYQFTEDELKKIRLYNNSLELSSGAKCEISGHIRNIGDKSMGLNILGDMGCGLAIEGLSIQINNSIMESPTEFRYRTRNRDGLDVWKNSGEFSGSRGRNMPIFDIEFSIHEKISNNYKYNVFIKRINEELSELNVSEKPEIFDVPQSPIEYIKIDIDKI